MKKIIEAVSLLFTVAAMFYFMAENHSLKKERDLYKTKIENDFKTKYTAIEQQLRDSERERVILADSLNTRNIHIQTLNRVSDSLTNELKLVPGRYKKLNSSEKAIEMERRANGN